MYVEQDADADPYAERYARYAAPEADMAEPTTLMIFRSNEVSLMEKIIYQLPDA